MSFRKIYLTSTVAQKGVEKADVEWCLESAIQRGLPETVINPDGFIFERITCRKGRTTFWIMLHGIGGLDAYVGLPSDFPGLVIYRETRAPIKRKRSSPPPRRPRRKK